MRELVKTPIFVRNASSISVPPTHCDGLVFDLFPEPNRSTIAANLGCLVEQVGLPTQAGIDFLLLSSAIYAADKKTPRRFAPDRWTRSFDVLAPVAEPTCWANTTPPLIEALSFLTGDHWAIQWRLEHNSLWNARYIARTTFDVVCLFSGGLDSLVGAINLLEDPKQQRVLLLGHYDGNLTPRVQMRLATALKNHYGHDRVHLVQVLVRPAEARLKQQYPLPTWREATTRSRSLVFLGLGLAAASALGPTIPLYVPENGFITLNVPLIKARLGSCSTRTTHPYFFTQLRLALAVIGLINPVVNPFEHVTKGEILAHCQNQILLEELAYQTVSCAHPDVGRYTQASYGNCGYCFPCLIRRASLHTIHLDDPAHYTYDVCMNSRLVEGRSARGRDVRAIFAALQYMKDSGPLTPLLSGPLPDSSKLHTFLRVYRQGLDELQRFFVAKLNTDIRQIAGI
jgi:7-cyano-7-deazaguanine synthase in queuosine biosynthesis